jgi:hypothetical protein
MEARFILGKSAEVKKYATKYSEHLDKPFQKSNSFGA